MGRGGGNAAPPHSISSELSWQVLCSLHQGGWDGGYTQAGKQGRQGEGEMEVRPRSLGPYASDGEEWEGKRRIDTATRGRPAARPHNPPKEPHLRDRGRIPVVGHVDTVSIHGPPVHANAHSGCGRGRHHSRAQAMPCHAMPLSTRPVQGREG